MGPAGMEGSREMVGTQRLRRDMFSLLTEEKEKITDLEVEK